MMLVTFKMNKVFWKACKFTENTAQNVQASWIYRVSQVKLDETKQLLQTENNPWSQKRDMYTFFRS